MFPYKFCYHCDNLEVSSTAVYCLVINPDVSENFCPCFESTENYVIDPENSKYIDIPRELFQ